MMVIGICGGVASGKSLVAREFERLGAVWIDADRMGHEALEDPMVKNAIRRRWGESVFSPNGQVSRPAVAKLVFAPSPTGPTELAELEKITHPLIGRMLVERLAQLDKQQTPAVLDAAVMFRAGWDRVCDQIIFVDAPRETRLARARQRGWTEQEFNAREAAQESLDWKRQRADLVIDNSGSPAHTTHQIQQIWPCISRSFPS